MKFKFASWNIRNISDPEKAQGLVNLIVSEKPDLLALQEVNPKFHATLSASHHFDWAASSLNLRPPSEGESSDRKRGCSLFGKAPFVLSSCMLLTKVPFPEQTLVAEVSCPEGVLNVCSFHIPPGSSHPREKTLHLYGIAYWLSLDRKDSEIATRARNVVLGIDANEPKADRLDLRHNEWWRCGARELLGAPAKPGAHISPEWEGAWHDLKDTFRTYLEANPDQTGSVSEKGPLARSYNRGHGDKEAWCRYDFIYATPNLSATTVNYLSEESRKCSDHAMVVAELEFSRWSSKAAHTVPGPGMGEPAL
jgi:exonuclease III